MSIDKQNDVISDINDLPFPWFTVDHGMDNCEEAILLTEIVAIKITETYLSGNRVSWEVEQAHPEAQKNFPLWNINVTCFLKSGRTFKLDLTPKGYDKFIKALSEVK